MSPEDLKGRTKGFGLCVIRLLGILPRSVANDVMGRQLIRSATSVGANYRAACRARSANDFIAKMKIVEEEADESVYWLEMLVESGAIKPESAKELLREGNEILAITVASIKTKREQNS
jgi:four helix bundle protein